MPVEEESVKACFMDRMVKHVDTNQRSVVTALYSDLSQWANGQHFTWDVPAIS